MESSVDESKDALQTTMKATATDLYCHLGHPLTMPLPFTTDSIYCQYCRRIKHVNSIPDDTESSIGFFACQTCQFYVCDKCTDLSHQKQYNFSIAAEMYQKIANNDTMKFVRQFGQCALKSINSFNEGNGSNNSSDLNEIKAFEIDFDAILNEWHDCDTLKTLLMAAVADNNFEAADTLLDHKVRFFPFLCCFSLCLPFFLCFCFVCKLFFFCV